MSCRLPCPECCVVVDARPAEVEGQYPGALVFAGYQVKRGPEHNRRCKHWRKEIPR